MSKNRISDILKDPDFVAKVAKDYVDLKQKHRSQAIQTLTDDRWEQVVAFFNKNPNISISDESLSYLDSIEDIRRVLKDPTLDATVFNKEYLLDVIQAFSNVPLDSGFKIDSYELFDGESIIVINDKLKVVTIFGQGSLSTLSAYTEKDVEIRNNDYAFSSDAIHEIEIDPRWNKLVNYLKNTHSVLKHYDLKTISTEDVEISTEFQALVIGACVAKVRIDEHTVEEKSDIKGEVYRIKDVLRLEAVDNLFSKQYLLSYAHPE